MCLSSCSVFDFGIASASALASAFVWGILCVSVLKKEFKIQINHDYTMLGKFNSGFREGKHCHMTSYFSGYPFVFFNKLINNLITYLVISQSLYM